MESLNNIMTFLSQITFNQEHLEKFNVDKFKLIINLYVKDMHKKISQLINNKFLVVNIFIKIFFVKKF